MTFDRALVTTEITSSDGISERERDQILASLRVNGLAVLRGYLRGDALAALQETASLATQRDAVYNGPGALKIEPHDSPWTREFAHPFLLSGEATKLVSSPAMLDLVEAYLDDKAMIHHAIFQRSFPVTDPIVDWHIDCGSNKALNGAAKFGDLRLRSIVYLSNVTSGGFSYILGSRTDALSTFLPLPPRELFPQEAVPADERRRVTIDEPAGTMILFDTHGLHRPEAPKTERLVLNTWFARKDFSANLPPTLFSLALVPEDQRDRVYIFENERGNNACLQIRAAVQPSSVLTRIVRRISNRLSVSSPNIGSY